MALCDTVQIYSILPGIQPIPTHAVTEPLQGFEAIVWSYHWSHQQTAVSLSIVGPVA
jgi:hypothetical protein